MANSVAKGMEDLTVCSICNEGYDLELRLPKMLDFCHHTCCLSCTKNYSLGIIFCPYKCKLPTNLDGRLAEDLTTNFYIFPLIEKMAISRKKIETLHSQAVNNRTEAITLRREVLGEKLKTVSDAIHFCERHVSQVTEENDKQIFSLQSLLMELRKVLLTPNHLGKCQSALDDSVVDLTSAKTQFDEWIDLEDLFSKITVTNSKDGKVYRLKEESSEASSPCVTLLKYVLHQLKAADLLEEITPWDKQQQTLAKEEPLKTKVVRLAPVSIRPRTAKTHLIFNVDGITKPVVVIKLLFDEAPLMCEAFMKLCLGLEHFTYKGTAVYTLKNGRRITAGNFDELNLTSEDLGGKYSAITESKRRFLADKSKLPEKKGSIRMRNRGQCERGGIWVCCEFTISCSDDFSGAPNRFTTVFGYVNRGMDVCEEICRLDPTRHEVYIESCGVWPLTDKEKKNNSPFI